MRQESRDRTGADGFNEWFRWDVRTDESPAGAGEPGRDPEPGFNGFGWR